nr:MAG TPA: hypothetical protein [Caudoviricetes sp.]
MKLKVCQERPMERILNRHLFLPLMEKKFPQRKKNKKCDMVIIQVFVVRFGVEQILPNMNR